MNIKKLSSILLAGVLCLSPLGIQASTTYATSEDGSKSYTSIDDAWSAAQNGTKIIMQEDWNISSRLVLDSNKTATIEMNGHKISRGLSDSKSNGEVIKLCSNSTLNLNGKNAPATSFTFDGYNKGSRESTTLSSGGLITGGNSTNGGGGIHMKGSSTLNLDSIAISGNSSFESWKTDGNGGGICMDGDKDTVTLTNAQITYNKAEKQGGGIYIDDESSNVKMVNSQISYNYAGTNGGAIASNDEETTITLDNSSMMHNYSCDNGGAVHFFSSKFTITSEKCNSEISYNDMGSITASGGGIFVQQSAFETNYGTINGLKLTHNNSPEQGGAITIYQDNITVSNCTITENTANEGGAISIHNDGFKLENSTIQSNTTNDEDSGAVFVDSSNDIDLSGNVIIKDNANTELNSISDLYLETGIFTNAYITSAPDTNSTIGIRVDSARAVAKNQNEGTRNVYYLNNGFDYYLDYSDGTISTKVNSADRVITSSIGNDEVAQEETIDEPVTYTITLNLVNEAGTWQSTKRTELDALHLLEIKAPSIDGKTFVEFKDIPEGMNVEEDVIKTDEVTQDMDITVVYSDEDSENLETGSIFGESNSTIIAIVIVGILAIGLVTFFMKKKKSS